MFVFGALGINILRLIAVSRASKAHCQRGALGADGLFFNGSVSGWRVSE